MSGHVFITYRKSLKPWPRYRMRFRLVGSDPSWNDMRFELVRVDAMRCAAREMKGAASVTTAA